MRIPRLLCAALVAFGCTGGSGGAGDDDPTMDGAPGDPDSGG